MPVFFNFEEFKKLSDQLLGFFMFDVESERMDNLKKISDLIQKCLKSNNALIDNNYIENIYSLYVKMFKNKEELPVLNELFQTIKNVVHKNSDFIDIELKFIDLNGNIRHLIIGGELFTKKLLLNGIGFDGSSVTGFRKVSAGDLVLIPDLTTFHIDPFINQKSEYLIISFFCSIHEAKTKKPFSDDPVNIAKKVIKFFKEKGIADLIKIAPEYEFYLFEKISFDIKDNFSFCRVDVGEAYWNESVEEKKVYPFIKNNGYHQNLPNDSFFSVRSAIIKMLKVFNIKFKYHHHEVGSASQHEIEVPLTEFFTALYHAVLIKYIIKNIASMNNLFATFMPKPINNNPGSGLHCHLTLFKKDNNEKLVNIFYSESGNYAKLSQTALYFISGILYHGRSLCALTNPSINSYKRLVKHQEAPVNFLFSSGNRTAAIRIPEYSINPEDLRIEYRVPDFMMNPFIGFSGLLMAGAEGIKNKIDPEKNNLGPVDRNIYELSEEELKNIKTVPDSFFDALIELEKDKNYLLQENVFTNEFIESWIMNKLKDIELYNKTVTPVEFKLYFDR